MNTREELINRLEEDTKVLKSEKLKEAFESIDRADFILEDYKVEAYEDYPLPIGSGQTISQPTTVAFMLELLDPQKGEKILDVGSGSGWTTTLLSKMVGEKGNVLGVEIVPELVSFGKENIAKYNFKNSEIIQASDVLGVPEKSPFDKILVSAVGEEIPSKLVDQLKEGGILVAPVKDSVCVIEKKENNGIIVKEYPGFVFVPLITGK